MPTLLSLNIATLLGFRLFIFRHYILYNTCIKINLKGLQTRLWGTVIHFVVPRRPSSYLYVSWITNFLTHTVKPIQLSSLIWLNDPVKMTYKQILSKNGFIVRQTVTSALDLVSPTSSLICMFYNMQIYSAKVQTITKISTTDSNTLHLIFFILHHLTTNKWKKWSKQTVPLNHLQRLRIKEIIKHNSN